MPAEMRYCRKPSICKKMESFYGIRIVLPFPFSFPLVSDTLATFLVVFSYLSTALATLEQREKGIKRRKEKFKRLRGRNKERKEATG